MLTKFVKPLLGAQQQCLQKNKKLIRHTAFKCERTLFYSVRGAIRWTKSLAFTSKIVTVSVSGWSGEASNVPSISTASLSGVEFDRSSLAKAQISIPL